MGCDLHSPRKISNFAVAMYKHLNSAQRYAIFSLLANKISFSKIAKTLSISVSTVSREIKRNSGKRGYHPKLAHEMACERRQWRVSRNRSIPRHVKERCLKYLTEEQWSPEQISGYLAREGIKVSHETIYKWIREDKAQGGTLYKHLRHRGKHRKRCIGKCPQIKDRISIHDRPVEADGKRFGDWEMDTIIGKDGKGAILTLTERSTNYVLIKRLKHGKNPKELAQDVKWLLFPYRHLVRTITTDNGIEFCEHRAISKALGVTVYFADPYSSWQKGCIENANKLIRQYIPKSIDFENFTDEQIAQIQYKINRRPRKKLNFYDPKTCFFHFF